MKKGWFELERAAAIYHQEMAATAYRHAQERLPVESKAAAWVRISYQNIGAHQARMAREIMGLWG